MPTFGRGKRVTFGQIVLSYADNLSYGQRMCLFKLHNVHKA